MSETIVVVRTHFVEGHVLDLAAALHVPGEYRVVFAVDESAGTVDTGAYDKLSLTRERFDELGLFSEIDDIFWRAGDYAFYCAQNRYPDAERFWLVEYDVAINRPDPVSFLREIDAASNHDLVSPHYREPEEWWFFAEHLRGVYPTMMRCFFPLVRLSSRAVRYALSERVRLSALERAKPADARTPWPNDEVFIASSLHHGGFACADTAELGAFYTQETFWFTPLWHKALLPAPDGRLYHPVREGTNYLKAIRQGAVPAPGSDARALLDLYADLDDGALSELRTTMVMPGLHGTADDPGRFFGPGSPARKLLDASPIAASMQDVVRALVSARKWLCLAWLRRNRACQGWPHISDLDNLALGMPADQSSYSPWSSAGDCRRDAEGGNDGRIHVDFGFHTSHEDQPFWTVDLGHPVRLTGAWIFNRVVHWERLRHFDVLVSDDGGSWRTAYVSAADDVQPTDAPIRVALEEQARYLRIRARNAALHLREVMVFGHMV